MKNVHEITEMALKAGSNSLSVFGGRFEGGYQLQQDIQEVSECLAFVSSRKNTVMNYLEIGVAAAGFTRLFCDVINVKNAFLMDLGTHPSIPAAYQENIKNLRLSGKMSAFTGDSHSPEAEEWLEKTGTKFDFIFIDGDHSYSGVLQDTLLAMKFAIKRAMFMFHDHACVGDIGRLYNEMKNRSIPGFVPIREFVSNSNTKKGIVLLEYIGRA